MTISRPRLALAAVALLVLGAIGGVLALVAATTPTATVDAVPAEAMAADDALVLDTLGLAGNPPSSDMSVPAKLLARRDRIEARIADVRGRLVHGTLTVLDRDGKLVTYQLDHGTVSGVGSATITIAEAGGSTVTVSTTSATRIRKNARPSTLADLRAGDHVVIRSTVVGGNATASLVVVPPANSTVTAPSTGNG